MSNKLIYVLKADGTKELFDVVKLEESLLHSGASPQLTADVILHIIPEIEDGMTTQEIYRHAFEMLHKEEKPVAIKYSLRHAIMELGPSGFPFEDFVAEIFRAKGFQAVTDQTVKGFCTQHEIDVVAWNDKKLIMVEAKFHNELGTKSDLKVVLYIKARFDDLRKMKFNYGREREIDEAWLVTNTKFSSTAIEYGSCQGGLVMVGWNYPPVGNLHDMITENKLHPLTCLVSLNGREKKELLGQGIVLCKTIKENPTLLEAIGVKGEDASKVMEEINNL
ncbi:MAG TPA: restriction endonuclease [Candidatus Paceibacterota bacterium]